MDHRTHQISAASGSRYMPATTTRQPETADKRAAGVILR